MDKHPLSSIQKLDPEFFRRISECRDYVFAEGALPAKLKLLIAMALDAVHGATGGVTSLARQALQHGASREEIMEALHVAAYIGGVGSAYTASLGLGEVLE